MRAHARILGVPPAAAALVLAEQIHHCTLPLQVVLAAEFRTAEQLAEDVALFLRTRDPSATAPEVHLVPELREDDRAAADDFETACDRLAILEQLAATAAPRVLVATPHALLQGAPTPERFRRDTLRLHSGQHISREAVLQSLLAFDYDAEALCEAPGQYAIRGGIIDIYPVTANRPYRLDFFGDELESIRAFDPVTQRSAEAAESITLAPPPGGAATEQVPLIRHLSQSAHWLVLEPDRITRTQTDDESADNPWTQILATRAAFNDCWTEISDIDLGSALNEEPLAYDAESLSTYRPISDDSRLADERLIEEHHQRGRFFRHLATWHRAGEWIAIVIPRTGEEERVRELLREEPELADLKPQFLTGSCNEGVRIRFRPGHQRLHWPHLEKHSGLVLVSETEIFGCQRRRRPAPRARARVTQSQVDQLLDFSELVEGEFVVHLQHGIAIYRGVAPIEVRGERREVLTLEFEDGVHLHVPLQESHLVSRYVGLTKMKPQLGRIGSGRWEKARAAAERATLDYAARLLELQARRSHQPGFAFPPDNNWQREFEATFPYRETPDQARAIADTKSDMEKSEPMDRLICGDVGFGKTEVAIRAAFKAVMGGRQVAVLVPTTVLAQQHFRSFRERMAGFPVAVEMVSRFRTKAEQTRILQALAEGRVDILVGTHRLIQSDVRFRNLGLVVVDEEQRFGVRHKEVFKEWRTHVDLLSMSATPIPRTLYLALTGARNLSVIETAPAERRPIQTIVKAYDEKLVVEVIRRELRRGGQVFYLHNRVQTIDAAAARLRELLPEATFGVGHGQMESRELESIMLRFIEGRFQVLVCTTIIESGIDIPNCNTLIIEGADRFGLSQLYQLRGRVGRFRQQAYAYLLLHRHTRLLDVARKRLHAIRQHNQLGAGFRIAMRDLELRGAGNLLGSEQSGHIVGVGFELYCQLLRQSISRLKGEPAAAQIRASVKLDFLLMGEARAGSRPTPAASKHQDGYTALRDEETAGSDCPPAEARIPHDYIPELRLRVDLYRRLAMCENLAAVRQLASDIQDRFGSPPESTRALLLATEVRCLAESKLIVSVECEGNRLKLRRASGRSPASPEDFVMLGARFPRLTGQTALVRLREVFDFLNNL